MKRGKPQTYLLRTEAWITSVSGPHERAFADKNGFTINEEAFEDAARVELRYEKVITGERWRVYEVKIKRMH
ncbi:MAG TPA: hypothetical protein VMW67_06460 [Desulfobacteria bacterium]|nr:hypothetical protein [Desulfobacteria bacterium]